MTWRGRGVTAVSGIKAKQIVNQTVMWQRRGKLKNGEECAI